MFVVVVALFFVLIMGAIMFTDLVEGGATELKASLAGLVRRARSH
ncbi:hypothetical protein A8924_3805 [Saccharopolyspora erythraea NRRL 2338]|uniref:Uncharacterized protein n=2 Tax=Saccharopolyspora erythraea TaxID=1836 RepID=A4FF63_SACEN|nr:hypothetical protein [Saccharopolyspora erythraea]EQD86052.1 hypothetical protein N599_11775 [Saccharopolyspora erythraea D]PFG96412.1 hypothetical protein A8924_3805 [Saccharopolyspora erythraea NRRL 2338]CAM02688.1 hypothetical protein SACE_3413 [Saccharopolyspora erythraea NRRL 2338]